MRDEWNINRVCDFDSRRISRQFRLSFLKNVRTYHKYIMGFKYGCWEFYDSDLALKYVRQHGRDTVGTVVIYQDASELEINHVSGDHMYQVLCVMIHSLEERMAASSG